MEIREAIEIFVEAFSAGKSWTYPYAHEFVDGVWVMKDHPPRKNQRKAEVIAFDITPAEAIERTSKMDLGRHFICHIHPESELNNIRSQYKALNYRALSTEWLFIHDLQNIPELNSDPTVRLVQDSDELSAVKQRASQPRKFVADTRLFGIWDDEQDYGWVRSIPVGESAWVSALHVHESDRGKGYGGALMSALLRDDKSRGVKTSVLLASVAGARLYPRLGYQEIATLQIFCPKKS